MRCAGRTLASLLVGVGLPATAAFASDLVPEVSSKDRWTIELGVEARSVPRFQGDDQYTFLAVPLFDARPAGTPHRFHAPRDGIGVTILDIGSFHAGPVAQIELGRHVKHNPDLAGLGNVGTAVEVGGFVDYWATPWLRARVELRQGFGGHHGIVSDESVDFVFPIGPQWTLSGGPRMTLATAHANDPYFSINAIQSANSGLPIYSAGGGIRAVGLGTQARYQWTPQWATHAYIEYQRLTDGVGNSPLVIQRGSPDQAMFGVGATYSFDMNALW
jgi:outer membrane protein